MTRKDYISIAHAIAQNVDANNETTCESLRAYGLAGLRQVAESLALALSDDNSRFDRTRFLRACNIEGFDACE